MYVSKRMLLVSLAAALTVCSLVFALQASADRGGDGPGAVFFGSSLAPSLPTPTDPTIHGVAPGGLPWALDAGSVELRNNGRVTIKVKGLVLTSGQFAGTPGPVAAVVGALYCGADSDMNAAASTGAVPLSSDGDAVIRTTVALPSTCLAPIVMVHPVIGGSTATGAYIAITGVMG